MHLLSKLIHQTRTLRGFILTLFLSLIIIAFITVITFTYSRNYEQIMVISREVSEKVSEMIVGKFTGIARGSERMTEITANLFFELGEISNDNELLKQFMSSIIKYDQQFANFYIGLSNGNFYAILNLTASFITTYLGNPNQPLSPDIKYAIRYVNRSKDHLIDTWYYLNEQFETVDQEVLPSVVFNPLDRPWYRGAVQNRSLYWSDFYSFSVSNERGISVSSPVFDKQKNIVAVVGADLTFTQLEHFLMQQMIGKTGRAFMIEKPGRTIIPDLPDQENREITSATAMEVMNWYEANPEHPDFVFKQEGIEYLAYVSKVPVIFGRDWRIIIIAPLQDFFAELIKLQRDILLIITGILVTSSLIIAYFANKISIPIVKLADEVNKVRQLELDSEVRVMSNIKEINLIDTSIATMRRAFRSFARYVPKEVVKDLFNQGEDIVLGGEKKEITIFFSDVFDFTTIAEALSIDVLLPILSEYFDVMTKIIHKFHGTIDKFLGDGIMAFWGAPLDIADHAYRACMTALECHVAIRSFNQKHKEEGKPEFRTRFGINTGIVIVGNIGTSDRMNYTIIGDAVNVTARLQELDKFYHTTIIISEDVYKRVKGDFLVRPLDVVNVKGKRKKIKIYELMAKRQGDPEIAATSAQIQLCEAFTDAYEAYMRKEYENARHRFSDILQKFPNDFPTQVLLKKIDDETSG